MILERVWSWLASQGTPIYAVGGSVRDWLLDRPIYDLDLAVPGSGLDLARRLANHFGGAFFPLDQERFTGRALLSQDGEPPLVVDVASFRGPDLEADLARRDFTINALAVDVRHPEQIIDPGGGLADVAARLIRPVSDTSIRDDPLRALRAVRQAAQLGMRLAVETETLIRRDAAGLVGVSPERIRDEWVRILACPASTPWVHLLDRLDLLTVVLPELEPLRNCQQPPPHYLDVLSHTLTALAALEGLVNSLPGAARPDPALLPLAPYASRLRSHLASLLAGDRTRLIALKLAALLHDVGKPATRAEDAGGRIRFIGHEELGAVLARAALDRLRFTSVEAHLVSTIVRYHVRPLLLAAGPPVSSRAVYRFFRDAGDAGVDVLILSLADHRAIYPPPAEDEPWPSLLALVRRMLSDYYDRRPERVTPPRLIRGHDLIAMGLDPGPAIGQVLESVREAQAEGIVTTRREALDLARRLVAANDSSRSEGFSP